MIILERCKVLNGELLAIGVIIFGVWMSTHHDSCRRSLTLPVLGLGAVIFLVYAFRPHVDNWVFRRIEELLHIAVDCILYLIMLFFILVSILVFTVFAFIVTNNGSGHSVSGLRYKEYQLTDYHSWFLKQMNNTKNWKHLKSCLVKSQDCNNLSNKYKNLKQLKSAELTPIEAGCCKPPSECGYPAVNASYYDLSFHPSSSNKDCKLYKNSRTVKCYNCDACKAGVAQYMKTEWRVVAIFNVILFVVLLDAAQEEMLQVVGRKFDHRINIPEEYRY
ncbi:hypothetical protein ACFE04_012609 [Oxalis oulophora]